MCLDSVSKKLPEPLPLIEGGYKHFDTYNRKLSFEAYPLSGSVSGDKTVPMDQWLKASSLHKDGKEIGGGKFPKYVPGFHIYIDESSSRSSINSTDRRVFYRGAHTYGRQDGRDCVIADELFVCSDPNGWPPAGGPVGDDSKQQPNNNTPGGNSGSGNGSGAGAAAPTGAGKSATGPSLVEKIRRPFKRKK